MNSTLDSFLARLRATAAEVTGPAAKLFARKDVKAVWDWVKEPLYAVALMFAITTIFVQPFYVPSGSMEPTLAIGDAVLAAKFPYGYTRYSMPFDYLFLGTSTTPPKPLFGRMPKVGDVVVFRLPRDTKVTFVKRVIGLPGDRIQMREGRLWINGKELPLRKTDLAENEDEAGETILMPAYIETLPNGREHRIFKKSFDSGMTFGGFDPNNTDVYVVPPGHVFMMGDNRDNSEDSRFPVAQGGVGYVPVGNLVGRPFIVIGSVDFKAASSIFEWPLQFRFSRLLHGIH